MTGEQSCVRGKENMRNKIPLYLFMILLVVLAAGCGKETPASVSGSTSFSSAKETASTQKEEVKESVTANRSIIAESLTGKVEALTETERYELVAGDKLESERYIHSFVESDLTMLLDADKHVYAGNDTKLHLTAEGKKSSSKTRIDLYEGTLVIGIDEKLNAEETFEINTPNATMAVRGTVFTITVERQKDRSFATNLKVDQGAVEAVTTENGEKKTETIEAGGSRVFTGENVTPPEVPAELVLQGFADRSFLSGSGTSGASSGSKESWDDYYRNPKEGYFFTGGTVYRLPDYYRDAVEEKGKETNGEVVGAGMVVFFDVPQEYNGEMIDHCCFLFCDREMPAKEEWDGVHMEFYGFWGEDYESPEPELDITEQVLGNLHTFYAYRHRKD